MTTTDDWEQIYLERNARLLCMMQVAGRYVCPNKSLTPDHAFCQGCIEKHEREAEVNYRW